MRDKDYIVIPESAEEFARHYVVLFLQDDIQNADAIFERALIFLFPKKHPFFYSCIADEFRKMRAMDKAYEFYRKSYDALNDFECIDEAVKLDIVLDRFGFFLLCKAEQLSEDDTQKPEFLSLAETVYAEYLYVVGGNVETRIIKNLIGLYTKLDEPELVAGLKDVLAQYDLQQANFDLATAPGWGDVAQRIEGIIAESFELDPDERMRWALGKRIVWKSSPDDGGPFRLDVA